MAPAAPLSPRIDDDMYSRLQELIQARTGLKFSEHQREATAKVLIKEMKHAGAMTPEPYYALLSVQSINASCWIDLIKALTICETYFFRDSDQMQMLHKFIIPDLLARHWNDHTLRLWSAGCATGEEAYTLAMLLRQVIPDINRWKISILASDINHHALEKARHGHYRDWSFRQQFANDPLVRTYFTQGPSGYQIHDQIKDMVHFEYLNLSEATFPSSQNLTDQLDLILCRNVTMYLSEAVIQSLARRFYDCLLPGGWLMLGASESNDQIYYQFKTLMYEKAIVYQKIMNHAAPILPQPPLRPEPLLSSVDFPTFPVFRDTGSFQPDSTLPGTIPGLSSSQPAADADEIFLRGTLPLQEPAADLSQKLYETSITLIEARQFEDAKKCLLAYLTLCPKDVEAQYQLTFIEANLGHLEEAQQMAMRITDQEPLFSKAYTILALIYQEQGTLDLAVTQLKKALYLDPEDIMANFNLAVLYQKQGLVNEALRYRQQSIKLAKKLQQDEIIAGSDHLSVRDFLNMAAHEI